MPPFPPFLLDLISLVITGEQYKSRSCEQLRNYYKYSKILIDMHLDILDIASSSMTYHYLAQTGLVCGVIQSKYLPATTITYEQVEGFL
jgi:hypothetical protein